MRNLDQHGSQRQLLTHTVALGCDASLAIAEQRTLPGGDFWATPGGMLDASITSEGSDMSKGKDQKKEQKKKPAKTLAEKREAKKAKKAGRS